MKSLALGVLLFLTVQANAIEITFDNTTAAHTDCTVDWSDGTWSEAASGSWYQNVPFDLGWRMMVDRWNDPANYLQFSFVGAGVFLIYWQDPKPLAQTLDHYTIASAENHIAVTAQTPTSLTFTLDRDVAVPEPSTVVLLLAGLTFLGLIRHKLT